MVLSLEVGSIVSSLFVNLPKIIEGLGNWTSTVVVVARQPLRVHEGVVSPGRPRGERRSESSNGREGEKEKRRHPQAPIIVIVSDELP
jgi:hypothetical protein